MGKSRRVVVIAYNGVDEFDLAGVLAPLVKASELTLPDAELNIDVVASGPCRGSSGLRISPDRTFSDPRALESLNALVIPGGKGAATAAEDSDLAGFVLRARAGSIPFYVVCSGLLILRDLKLLDGLVVASHAQKRQLLATSGCRLGSGVIRDQWLVSAGGFAPGDGPKGAEIAFHLLKEIVPDTVTRVAERMELWPQTTEQCSVEIRP
jgi:AraC family transcriptional regulator, transcriptional activator FtrA